MKFKFLAFLVIWICLFSNLGYGSTYTQYAITSDPDGAQIYVGTSPNNLSYYLTTPYSDYTNVSKGWSLKYFQARKEGYHDSEIWYQPTFAMGTDTKIHLKLKKKIVKPEAPKKDLIQNTHSKKTRSKKTIFYTKVKLKQLGYYNGKLDGQKNTELISAIRKYQIDSKLKVDGVVSFALYNHIKRNKSARSISETDSSQNTAFQNKAEPQQNAVTPLIGRSGRYLFPYKQSGILAAWADPSKKPVRKIANTTGGKNEKIKGAMADYYNRNEHSIGNLSRKMISGPFGGMLGSKIDSTISQGLRDEGREDDNRKLQSQYDQEYQSALKKNLEDSDLSFNSLEKMAIYLYYNYRNKLNYSFALEAAFNKYPDFKNVYSQNYLK